MAFAGNQFGTAAKRVGLTAAAKSSADVWFTVCAQRVGGISLMAGNTIHVQRHTAIALIAEVWNVPQSRLDRLSAVELDRILCTEDVSARAIQILRRTASSA